MSSSHLFFLSFLLVFVFLRPSQVLATNFPISHEITLDPQQDNNPLNDPTTPTYLELASSSNQVFGLSSQGNLDINLTFSITSTNQPCPARLALCQASTTFIRGPNYRRRQSRPPFRTLAHDVATTACNTSTPSPSQRIPARNASITHLAWCVTQNLCQGEDSTNFSVQRHNLEPNQMYLLAAALCNHTQPKDTAVQISFKGQAHFLNPDLIFPELGYEEVLFPIFAAIITALLAVTFLSLVIALLVSFFRRVPVRHIAQYVLAAVLLKLLVAVITFVHFFTIAQSGSQQTWYMYARLLFAFCADTLFIIALICIASGFGVMPKAWFVEDRSPIFIVYVAVVLQLLIIIAVKVMFPFQFLGAVTYTIAGAVIAVMGTVASNRNAKFLERYGHLIEQSHIFLKSTPIPGLRRFYILNTIVLPIAYTINIVSVILFDYILNRPDLFWGILETVDAILLAWLSVFVFPSPKSPLYVDMSNISNDRLHQAERWRARQQRLQVAQETNSLIPSRLTPPEVAEETNGDLSTATPENERQSAIRGRWRTMGENLMQGGQRILRPQRAQEVRGQAPRSIPDSTALDLGTGDTGNTRDVRDPQPPWIAWTSGMSLPRPTAYTWRGRRRPSEVASPEGNAVALIYTPIVLGNPEGSSDVVKLTAGVPVTGVDATPKMFNEKGTEVSEPISSGRSPGRLLGGAGGGDDSNADRSLRLNLSARLGLSSLRLYRVDQRTARQAAETKGPGTHGRRVRGKVGSSGQTGESGEDTGTDEITRNLSGSTSTIVECSDGTISILDIR